MKLELLVFWALAARVGASLAEYKKLCPDLHETKHEINPGEWVLVKCGWVGSHDGKHSQVPGVATPAACAQLCNDATTCTHSSWGVNRKCLLSGRKFTERGIVNSILLVNTIPDEYDECPEDNPYCGDEEISEEDMESNDQLHICQSDNKSCNKQLVQCLAGKEAQLPKPIDPSPPRTGSGAGDFPKCESSHNTMFTAPNNKSFKINCKEGGSFTPIKKYKSGTFARCVNECAYHPSCNAVEFIKAGNWLGHCQLYQLGKDDSGKWSPRENRASARLIQMGRKDDFFQKLLTSSAISDANYQRVRNCWRAIKNSF